MNAECQKWIYKMENVDSLEKVRMRSLHNDYASKSYEITNPVAKSKSEYG